MCVSMSDVCMYVHGHACGYINKHFTPRKCTSKIHYQVRKDVLLDDNECKND